MTLRATETVKIGDPQVVTILPSPDTSSAKVEMVVPLTNAGEALVHGTLKADFEGVTVTKNVDQKPGIRSELTPADFPTVDGYTSAGLCGRMGMESRSCTI